MLNAAIIGLGSWGQKLVNSVHGKSSKIRIVRGVTRTRRQGRRFLERHRHSRGRRL